MEYPQEIIKSIAQEIDVGMICYLNPCTMETDSVLGESYDTYWSGDYGDIYEEVEAKIATWERCIRIDPPESWESFRVMEDFIEYCVPDNEALKKRLWDAIAKRKPFQNFKYIIDNSPYRQAWFDFKQLQLEKYVRNLLESKSD